MKYTMLEIPKSLFEGIRNTVKSMKIDPLVLEQWPAFSSRMIRFPGSEVALVSGAGESLVKSGIANGPSQERLKELRDAVEALHAECIGEQQGIADFVEGNVSLECQMSELVTEQTLLRGLKEQIEKGIIKENEHNNTSS